MSVRLPPGITLGSTEAGGTLADSGWDTMPAGTISEQLQLTRTPPVLDVEAEIRKSILSGGEFPDTIPDTPVNRVLYENIRCEMAAEPEVTP